MKWKLCLHFMGESCSGGRDGVAANAATSERAGSSGLHGPLFPPKCCDWPSVDQRVLRRLKVNSAVEQDRGVFAALHTQRFGAGEARERDLARGRRPRGGGRLLPAEETPA